MCSDSWVRLTSICDAHLMAGTYTTYCQSRILQHAKCKSSTSAQSTITWMTLYGQLTIDNHTSNWSLWWTIKGADAAPDPAPGAQLRDGLLHPVAARQHAHPHHALHEPRRVRGRHRGHLPGRAGEVSCKMLNYRHFTQYRFHGTEYWGWSQKSGSV